MGALQGLDTVIIGSTANVLDGVVFARPEIKSAQDLRGKTIGVTNLKAITDVAARLGVGAWAWSRTWTSTRVAPAAWPIARGDRTGSSRPPA